MLQIFSCSAKNETIQVYVKYRNFVGDLLALLAEAFAAQFHGPPRALRAKYAAVD